MKAGYIVWVREFISPYKGWHRWEKVKGRNRFGFEDEAIEKADRWANQIRYQVIVTHSKKTIHSVGRQPSGEKNHALTPFDRKGTFSRAKLRRQRMSKQV